MLWPISDLVNFHNIGNEPLLISDVRTSCHCAVASYPRIPILPDETGDINLDLDTQVLGQFTKSVAVYSNAIHDYDSTINKSNGQSSQIQKSKSTDSDDFQLH